MKRLIILCDGTLEDADAEPSTQLYTNIGRLSRAIKEMDHSSSANGTNGGEPVEQIKMYLGGVGSEDSKVGGLVSGAFGMGMMELVRNIYSFLSLNWESGDEIFLFGFSRGAYTVRLVASLISIIGILHPRRTLQLFPQLFAALDQRTGDDPKGDRKSGETIQKLLSSYGMEKRKQDAEYARKGKFLIRFMGLFDTVATRGRPSALRPSLDPSAPRFDSFGFDETRLESIVQYAYQALALDEHRIDYLPVLWSSNPLGRPKGQQLQQVWFSGAHADVGGGYKEGDLGYLTLWWMCSKFEGLLSVDMGYLKKICAKTVETYGKMPPHKSRIGQFLLAKSVERPLPLSINPMTNECIHASVNFQPPSQLRPTVSALFSEPDMFTTLSPLEKELQTSWPKPGVEINEKDAKKKKKGKSSLSDDDEDTASVASNAATVRPGSTSTIDTALVKAPSASASTLVDEKSLSDEEKETASSRPSTSSSPSSSTSHPLAPSDDEDEFDDSFSPLYWRETSDRLTPNEFPRERWSPFKAAERKMRKIGEDLSNWEERREERREKKEIMREKKKERRK